MSGSDTPRTRMEVHAECEQPWLEWVYASAAHAVERELLRANDALAAAAAELHDLRLRVAQLEGVGDMWRAAELSLTKAARDRDGYAQQVQRLTDELRQAMRGAQ